MKEHNTDYLSDESLYWHPRLGIHASNVAPEFGVTETKEFLKVLEENGLNSIVDEFLELSFCSRKWEKWLLKPTFSSDREKAIIAGHYIFSTKEFFQLKEKASKELLKKNIVIDEVLKGSIKHAIGRYLKNFRLI